MIASAYPDALDTVQSLLEQQSPPDPPTLTESTESNVRKQNLKAPDEVQSKPPHQIKAKTDQTQTSVRNWLNTSKNLFTRATSAVNKITERVQSTAKTIRAGQSKLIERVKQQNSVKELKPLIGIRKFIESIFDSSLNLLLQIQLLKCVCNARGSLWFQSNPGKKRLGERWGGFSRIELSKISCYKNEFIQ